MTEASRRNSQNRSRGGTKRQSSGAGGSGRNQSNRQTTKQTSSNSSAAKQKSTAARARSRRAANRNRTRRVSKRTPVSRSVGAVVLNQNYKVLLVFQNKNKYWEFPKGKMERGERELETLRREIEEETGITKFRMLPRFRRTMQYDFQYQGKRIRREVIYFLIRTHQRVRVSDEHSQYKWLTFTQAKKYLKHENQVKLLEEVERRMKSSQTRRENERASERGVAQSASSSGRPSGSAQSNAPRRRST